ncbi:MAG: BtrH N-terminal domain-containing protein [bacterium]
MITNTISSIQPFESCPAMDGYHCQTNALAKIYYHYDHPISEDMLLGLGAGLGFIYWQMKLGKENYVFVGGRGNMKNFFGDIGARTGVKIKPISTSSAKKAEAMLVSKLSQQEPVMVFGDMGFLPWFELPKDYHFGGHTFIICGFDGNHTVLASDMDNKAAGLKKGFYYPITLEQLSLARNSKYKPFPPKNTSLEFEFSRFHAPEKKDITAAIKQTIEAMLNPPIKNFGVKGIRLTAKEILKWPKCFSDKELRANLFTLYIFIEVGGTGGGCFRYMYARFLKETAPMVKSMAFEKAAAMFDESGKRFTEIGLMFKDAITMNDIDAKLQIAAQQFQSIANIEEEALTYLQANIT